MNSLGRLARSLKRYRITVALSLLMLAASAAADLAVPRMTQAVIDKGILRHDMGVILRISLAMLGVTVLSAAFTVGNTVLAVRVSQTVSADLRRDLFVHIQSLSFGNLDRLQTGQLMIRLTSDVAQIMQFILMMMRMFVRAPLMIVGSLILLFSTNWQLALIMLVLMPASMAVLWVFVARTQPLYLQVQRKLGRLSTVLQENLAGVRVVKAFVRARHEARRFDQTNTELMSQTVQVGQLMAVLMPLLRLIANLGTLAVVYLGGLQAITGKLSVGQIVAFNNYIMSTMFPLMNLGMVINLVASADASASRIYEVIDSEPAIRESPEAVPLPAVSGRVLMENVSFSYNGDARELVLRDINLSAEPGEMVAVLGATGSGKSTLVDLIPRFYDVTPGRVTVDGTDIRQVTLDSLRSQVAVALQESILFEGTVRDNIRYGRPDASDDEVMAAAAAAQAHDFIMALPEGYDSHIGQRGVNLSGGQKQRLAIARALLVNPRILILDDSTSSVDLETELRIHEALASLMADRTCFIIAQRISTVLNAHKIVVLDRGTIVASGNHDELLATSPMYRGIYESQLGEGGDRRHE
jgi:ATP-binding cassette subfamily B protein